MNIINKAFKALTAIFLLGLYGCGSNATLTDIDGNIYPVIKIGNQVWMSQNLQVTKYRNGNPIHHIADAPEWSQTAEGAYCYYNNDKKYSGKYGILYNWSAINDSRNIAPEGWHIPSSEEIRVLINHLKGDTIAAGKMKSTAMNSWLGHNTGATNESGFSAEPGGYRFGDDGSYHTLGSNGYWWTTTGSFEIFSWSPRIFETFTDVSRDPLYMRYGLSVRCIKD